MGGNRLNAIFFNIRIYFIMISKYIKARMQYRADFIIGSIATAVEAGLGLIVLSILFKSITNIGGWSYKELLFIYSFTLVAMVPQSLLFDHFWSLSYETRGGSFIKYYFLPMNMLVYYMADLVSINVFGHLVLALTTFAYSIVDLGIHLTFYNVVFLLLSLFGSALIFSSMIMTASTICFILNSNDSLILFIYRLNEFAKYPTIIFKGLIKFILIYVIPVAFIGFYPALHFLRPNQGGIVVYLTPVLGVVMFILSYKIWCIGVSRYSGTGT
jgi:ABC-2 type transport system permease protein